MHLIIDGYNVIRQSSQLRVLDALDLQAGREALLELLAGYRSRSHHRITVVFDGWLHGDLKESRDRYQGILIIYSRRGERADEVIKRLLAREGSRAVLVSSDREIQDFADRQGATWVAAGQFETQYLSNGAAGRESADQDTPASRGGDKKGPARRLKKNLRKKKQRLRKL